MDSCSTYSAWIKLDKDYFGLDEHYFVGAGYIPPEDHSDLDLFEILETEVVKYIRQGNLMMGNFNAGYT